jgi:hypothetical protein
MYTLETLKEVNEAYDYNHGVSADDIDLANYLKTVIESRVGNKKPKPGDILDYINKYGEHFNKGHIECSDEDGLNICERPYTPFVSVSEVEGEFITCTSGGPWSKVKGELQWVGTQPKRFKAWGHCGMCAGGAFSFFAEVNVWRYVEPQQQTS